MSPVFREIHGLDETFGVSVILKATIRRFLGERDLDDTDFPEAGGNFLAEVHVDFY